MNGKEQQRESHEPPLDTVTHEKSSKLQYSSKLKSSLNEKDGDDIASAISHIVDRVCDDSVASDLSGLTDADVFRTVDNYASPRNLYTSKSVGSNNSSTKASNKSNNFKTKFRAPEPPVVTGGMPELADIESEATSTTVSSAQEEKMTTSKKRSVSFCEVQVRNYERILEVNPSVTSGPALGIGWNYYPEEDETFSLENFEGTREHARRHSMEDLALPRYERENILRSLGYSQKEIAGSVRTILRLKNQRKQTIHNLNVSYMEEFMESATRKMKRVLLFPLQNRKKVKDIYSYHRPSTLSTQKNLESSVLRKTSLDFTSAAKA